MNSIDIDLYKKTLQVRRKFLGEKFPLEDVQKNHIPEPSTIPTVPSKLNPNSSKIIPIAQTDVIEIIDD